MSHVCSALYVFNTHPDAQDAIRSLRSSGFDVKKLSLIGKGHNSEQTPIGFYTGGDRILTWSLEQSGVAFGAYSSLRRFFSCPDLGW